MDAALEAKTNGEGLASLRIRTYALFNLSQGTRQSLSSTELFRIDFISSRVVSLAPIPLQIVRLLCCFTMTQLNHGESCHVTPLSRFSKVQGRCAAGDCYCCIGGIYLSFENCALSQCFSCALRFATGEGCRIHRWWGHFRFPLTESQRWGQQV